MRMILAVAAVLYSASAFAQADKPPMVGDKPLVQVKPKGTKEAAAKPAAAAKGKPQSIAARLQACLEIDDGTKDRLNCYDAVIPPAPKPKPAKAKGYADCRFFKEEDERLACFNGFAESIPKLPKT
ncbi:hypothetical protein IVA87_08910 [Bradyrhizobium sp. 147]|uniref:Uncharacterized protein n=1 Tax=Bradyrhizobium zhanjiangense TaxID=1325107 RepID=A0A4Q0SLY1_9BRAD|nr:MULTISPECIES: hypothetical protein [Bradyrhizobium]MCK1424545.1 hypothetical protein [Bradyrhizobium sp. CW12]MCK1494811.1 hypothetical protein [Bradyrhizobium sp. 180]MCK1529025.1 hypothetical protein [Bradyrhizobium sp. 182]MCK1595911.1 hypothetical protein [Bradyrhizobium sp. 164]MCK1618008.1 hypothetical protein [Bradyrhizobium sp. 159]